MSGADPRGDDQFGNHDARAGTLPRNAVEVKLVICAVDHVKALVDVAKADAAGLAGVRVRRADADAVVDDVDNRVAVLPDAPDRDAAFPDLWGQPVFDRIFHE